MNVVGTIFIKDKKILLDKPRKRDTYQMVGGKVEKGESFLEAAIREIKEELGSSAIFDSNNICPIMDFDEIATNDPNLKIHFYVFMHNSKLSGELSISDEIESFVWYDTSMKDIPLSNTLKHKVIPYCIENNLIK